MGGSNLNDMLIALYRVNLHVKKQMYLEIIEYCVNICSANGWLPYKRFCDQMDIPKHSQRYFLQFTKAGTPKVKAESQPKRRILSPTSKVRRALVEA